MLWILEDGPANPTSRTAPAWPSRTCSRSPVVASHSVMVSSVLAVATVRPSALNAAAVTAPLSPGISALVSPVRVSTSTTPALDGSDGQALSIRAEREPAAPSELADELARRQIELRGGAGTARVELRPVG